MKAKDVAVDRKPFVVVPLGPRNFSSRWVGRPSEVVHVGLRLASADEKLTSALEADARTALFLPNADHSHHLWAQTHYVCWVHYVLGHVMTSAQDSSAPFWQQQDGSLLLCDREPHEPGACPAVSTRLSDAGVARLWDEYEALEVRCSEVWPELRGEELDAFADRLRDGSFLGGLDGDRTRAQARRLLHYLRSLGGAQAGS
jgi:hypothetical protein